MSSCLSGGGAYMVKSPPSHNTPSPSSTITESNSPPFLISTRRPRTPRKRPNQTYDEAAALLSTAYPNIFSSKKPKTQTFNKSPLSGYDEASQLLLPYESIEESEFLFSPTIPTKAEHFLEHKDVILDELDVNGFGTSLDDFDAGSILDEEIEEGIDSFMGSIESDQGENCYRISRLEEVMKNAWNGRFRLGLGLRSSLREHDDGNWCQFPTVEFEQISPRIQTAINAVAGDGKHNVVESKTTVSAEGYKKKNKNKNKNKNKKVTPAAAAVESKSSEDPLPELEQRVMSPLLKLDYGGVLEAWSGKESPFSDEIMGSDAAGIDLYTRLGEIDLFGESGMREASVLRYKEKRRNRLFSKKIRYQVRKLNADQRPRMKGRFVTRPNARNLSGIRV
ncbi:hypothetical protein CARUB_v10004999mg [Capsella rubella]|uniref:CCT domain-containing protein n=1 Tax=Capsella rubella TaxID=81985 RepID=R0GWT4_9BRAS|nr:protein CHLOROPLAST IMPORT APPARATUS 2 [Capsella rubella]EOA16780.1 hypothetical protein CARUB_v10004999mg [Capsella rubella]